MQVTYNIVAFIIDKLIWFLVHRKLLFELQDSTSDDFADSSEYAGISDTSVESQSDSSTEIELESEHDSSPLLPPV